MSPLRIHPQLRAGDVLRQYTGGLAAQGEVFFAADDQGLRLDVRGIIEIITTFIAIYGMLLVKKKTGNAWGCVFAFCLIWNAM